MTPPQHHRRSLRLKGYDYATTGAYFVTVCTQNRACLFGEVVDDAVRLNEYGDIVLMCWEEIPTHFANVALDAFVVMPNHVHGIMMLTAGMHAAPVTPVASVVPVIPVVPIGAQHVAPLPARKPHANVQPGSLGAIVRAFKSAVTQRINAARRRGAACCASPSALTSSVWQRNYYEHVIRNEQSLHRLWEYIRDNPARWADDEENPPSRRCERQPHADYQHVLRHCYPHVFQ
jgi:putative transposase